MALKSLNLFLKPRRLLIRMRNMWICTMRGVRMGGGVQPSLSSRIVTRSRGAVTIGDGVLISFRVLIMAFDPAERRDRPISIGRHCFIGGGSIITPGVTIGDEAIVAAGSVVFDDVPARTIVAGNP